MAAQRLLRGKIMEKETSTPICGACIAVKGTKQKTLSDKAGDYQLTVPIGCLHDRGVGSRLQTAEGGRCGGW